MDRIPQIRLVFVLTKNDSTDFDREAVTQRLCLTPTSTCEPILSKGELYSDADIHEVERELPGITILPAESPPYHMLKHAYWSIELPKMECWSLEEPLSRLEQILSGKESRVLSVCEEYNLSADLTVRVFAESNDMPELIIPRSSVSYWASMGVTIGFDFYLD